MSCSLHAILAQGGTSYWCHDLRGWIFNLPTRFVRSKKIITKCPEWHARLATSWLWGLRVMMATCWCYLPATGDAGRSLLKLVLPSNHVGTISRPVGMLERGYVNCSTACRWRHGTVA